MRALDVERQIRAARIGVDDEDAEALRTGATGADGLDAEARARLELRSQGESLGSFILAAVRGRAVTGVEAELQQAAGVDGIPLEIFDTQPVLEARARRDAGTEHRDISPAPSVVGVNLDPVRPAVFSPSIADRLMIEMPQVESGTYASATVSTSLTADAVAKSRGRAADSRRAHGWHHGAASCWCVARVGTRRHRSNRNGEFESALRENVSLTLSAELDDQMIQRRRHERRSHRDPGAAW